MIDLKLFLVITLTSVAWFIVGFNYGKFIERSKRFRKDEKRTIFRKN